MVDAFESFSKQPVSDKHEIDVTHDNTEAICVLRVQIEDIFIFYFKTLLGIWKRTQSSNAEKSKAKSLENIHNIQCDTKPFFSAVWIYRLKRNCKPTHIYTRTHTHTHTPTVSTKPSVLLPPIFVRRISTLIWKCRPRFHSKLCFCLYLTWESKSEQ